MCSGIHLDCETAASTKGTCRFDDNKKRLRKKKNQTKNKCVHERTTKNAKTTLIRSVRKPQEIEKRNTFGWDSNSIELASAIRTQLIWRAFITKCLNIVHTRRVEHCKYVYEPIFFFLLLSDHIFNSISPSIYRLKCKVSHRTRLRQMASSI